MKVLLIGPYPPPHGGVSVHVAGLRRDLLGAGIECRVLNIDRRAPDSAAYERIRGGGELVWKVLRYGLRGWTLHVHINGHNEMGWLVALLCGLAGRFASRRVLTLHSGMAPEYLRGAAWRRALAGATCRLYHTIIPVAAPIAGAVRELGVSEARMEVMPAFLPPTAGHTALPDAIEHFFSVRRPVLSTALFFRPEYGFELLVDALHELHVRWPELGCVVMGSGECESDAHALVRRAGLDEAVLFAGDLDHDVCLAVMARSDVFMRPTLADGDSISVREAVALGVHVVASDVTSRPEGVLLFSSGSSASLIEAVDRALKTPKPLSTAPPDTAAHQLLRIYGSPVRSLSAAPHATQT